MPRKNAQDSIKPNLKFVENFFLGFNTKVADALKNKILKSSNTVSPTQGFCLKTRNEFGDKIFFNICHCENIPKPPPIPEYKLAKFFKAGEDYGYRIPMNYGDVHKERDSNGNECQTFDILVNTEWYNKSLEKSQVFTNFLATQIMNELGKRFHLNIDRRECTKLKKKYFGNMTKYFILNTTQMTDISAMSSQIEKEIKLPTRIDRIPKPRSKEIPSQATQDSKPPIKNNSSTSCEEEEILIGHEEMKEQIEKWLKRNPDGLQESLGKNVNEQLSQLFELISNKSKEIKKSRDSQTTLPKINSKTILPKQSKEQMLHDQSSDFNFSSSEDEETVSTNSELNGPSFNISNARLVNFSNPNYISALTKRKRENPFTVPKPQNKPFTISNLPKKYLMEDKKIRDVKYPGIPFQPYNRKIDKKRMAAYDGDKKIVPKYQMMKFPEKGYPKFLRYIVELPNIKSDSQVNTKITMDALQVESTFYSLNLKHPFLVKKDESSIFFDKKARALNVTLSIIPSSKIDSMKEAARLREKKMAKNCPFK